jgi:hypothetical protein
LHKFFSFSIVIYIDLLAFSSSFGSFYFILLFDEKVKGKINEQNSKKEEEEEVKQFLLSSEFRVFFLAY